MRSTGLPAAPTTSSTTSIDADRDRACGATAAAGHPAVQSPDSKQAADDDPTLAAVVHTARKYGIAWELFDDFLASMRMDLTVTDYPDRTRWAATCTGRQR